MHALKAQLVLYRCTSRFESRQAASPAFCWGKERERSLLVLARISSIFCWSSSEIRTNTNPAVSVRSALPHSHTHKKLVFHTTRVTQRNEPDRVAVGVRRYSLQKRQASGHLAVYRSVRLPGPIASRSTFVVPAGAGAAMSLRPGMGGSHTTPQG
jgi:hypothetical protein